MLGLARILAGLGGLLLIGLGIWLVTYDSSAGLGLVVTGILTAVVGVVIIGALFLERIRYSSAAAERPPVPGPPGGDASGEALEPRFRPTDEVFVDPTSGRTMRVYLDPGTGERRYRAEA
jgi:hypothetical protein